MNTRSAREYTMFAPAQLLRHWREQRRSNQGDLDSSVTVEVGRVYYTGVDLLLTSFLYRTTWLLLGCVLNGTLKNLHGAVFHKTLKLPVIKERQNTHAPAMWCNDGGTCPVNTRRKSCLINYKANARYLHYRKAVDEYRR
jgi:hypothetical protein